MKTPIDRSLNYGRHHVRRFLEKAHPFKAVIDLGAGWGSDLHIAREVSSRARLIAVESWQPTVKRLKREGVEVRELDLERDRLPEDADAVIANQILEHTKDIFWIFHEVTRILPTGGHFIVGLPNLASLHNRVLLALGKQPTAIKSRSAHVRGFRKGDVLEVLEAAFPKGYALRDFGGSNFYPFPPGLARPLAAAFPKAAWGIFFLLRKEREYDGEFIRYPRDARLETNFYLG